MGILLISFWRDVQKRDHMLKKVTLSLDEAVLVQAKRLAHANNQSISRWVADLIAGALTRDTEYAAARRRALAHLDKGFNLGGKPLSREEIYDRRTHPD